MNTAPSSAPRFSSTAASGRPGSGQDQPQVDATRRVPAAGERALVLHGGGSAGNAWEIGVIAGLFDAGLDVTEADLIIGTSAGSTAAAQITSATPAELLAAILAAAPQQETDPFRPGGGRVPIGPAADHMESDEFELTQEFAAMMLGASRQTVTMAAGALQKAGTVRYQRGHVMIVDRAALERASCECYRTVVDLLDRDRPTR